MKCETCEMLTTEPIKITTTKTLNHETYYFTETYKCQYSGQTSQKLEKLPTKGCRLKWTSRKQ